MQKFEKFKFVEIKKEGYESLCGGRDIPLTQHWFYGEWQEALDKKVWRYGIEDGEKIVGFFQVIKYPMSYGKSYLYIPHGPVFANEVSDEFPSAFEKFSRELLKKEDSIFLRFDLSGVAERLNLSKGSTFRRVPKFMYDGSFQPKFEWVLDLSQTEEEILAGMKKVNRYTVRQAEKLGVKVEIVKGNFKKYLDRFYELIEATAERDEFSHNPREYYAKIFEECEKNKNAFMEVARYRGEIVLVNFFVIYGDAVFFLFSGSENKHRRTGYTYLAQWEAIKHAKKLGLKKYNFGAVITDDDKYSFYKTWQGFSDFKKRFGGLLMEYTDFCDIVNSKFWYILYILKKSVIYMTL